MGHYDSDGNYVFGEQPLAPSKARPKSPGKIKDEQQQAETYWESRDALDRQLEGKKPKGRPKRASPKKYVPKKGLTKSEALDAIEKHMSKW